MSLILLDTRGLSALCECGQPATGGYLDTLGKPRMACDGCNPYAGELPSPPVISYEIPETCGACGQPKPQPSRVIYPGTAGVSVTVPAFTTTC